jgi:hypothetical protein
MFLESGHIRLLSPQTIYRPGYQLFLSGKIMASSYGLSRGMSARALKPARIMVVAGALGQRSTRIYAQTGNTSIH